VESELIKYIENEFHATYYNIAELDFSKNRKALEYINNVRLLVILPIALLGCMTAS
jgi:ribosomal protein S17E